VFCKYSVAVQIKVHMCVCVRRCKSICILCVKFLLFIRLLQIRLFSWSSFAPKSQNIRTETENKFEATKKRNSAKSKKCDQVKNLKCKGFNRLGGEKAAKKKTDPQTEKKVVPVNIDNLEFGQLLVAPWLATLEDPFPLFQFMDYNDTVPGMYSFHTRPNEAFTEMTREQVCLLFAEITCVGTRLLDVQTMI